MKIAFVGGTRFVGRAAAARAIERGHEVSVLHRGRHPSDLAAARPVLVDRADPSALAETIARLEPDVVVDTHARTRPEAEASALAVKIAGLPCVVLSSRASLETDVQPVFEAATRDSVPSVTVLRLPAVYGWNNPRRRFAFVVDRLDAGERRLPCTKGASVRTCHCHVRDAAHAVVLAAERRGTGFEVLDVGEETTPTWRERCDAFASAMGSSIEWLETPGPLPRDLEMLGASPDDLVDSTAIRAALDFAEITTAEERIADQIAWLRASRGSTTLL